MAAWGGSNKFANAFFNEYSKANPGGVVRARMLSDIFRLFQVHTQTLKGNASPIEAMTDEELSAALHELMPEDDTKATPKVSPADPES